MIQPSLLDELTAKMGDAEKQELREILGGDAQWQPGEWERIRELLTPAPPVNGRDGL